MALYIDNTDQARSITSGEAIEVLEDGLKQLAFGNAIRRPRIDNQIPTTRPDQWFSFSSMEGGVRAPGYYALRIKPDVLSWPIINGMKRRATYNTRPGLYGGLVFLFNVDNAELLAIMNDGYVQHLRVAANAAIGAKYLARKDAKVVAMLGSGGMARTFAEALCAVRNITTIKAFSPNPANLDAYVREMSERLDCEVAAVSSVREALRGADIVCACTNSMTPLFPAEWIEPGMHVTNVMSWELGPDICARVTTAGVLVRRTPPSVAGFVDDDFAVRMNVMTYTAGQPHERETVPISSWVAQGIQDRSKRYPNAVEVDCLDWRSGQVYERQDDEITTLSNQSFGIPEGEVGASAGSQGIQFSTIGGRIYEGALRQGLGKMLPQEMFVQDIPT